MSTIGRDRVIHTLADSVHPRLLDAVRVALAELQKASPLAVAVSGGTDSSMLAVHAAHVARTQGRMLHMFHIHHGLHDKADSWAQHVGALAGLLDLPHEVVRVSVDTTSGLGIEAAARSARYAALADLAQRHGVRTLLLAHHRHDQAETLLLRLLRGSGPQGMAGMASHTQRDGVTYLRPWLEVDRRFILAQAQRWAQTTGWQAVSDPSNEDPRYARGAVRTLLTPALDAHWPGWRDNLARHARQAAETSAILNEVAQTDFAGLAPSDAGRSFDLSAWRLLASARQALVLRYWFDQHDVRMPTAAKLAELMRQLRQLHALGHDRHMLFEHDTVQVRCLRGRVLLTPRIASR